MAYPLEDHHYITPISPSANHITSESLSNPAGRPNLDSEGLQVDETIQSYDKPALSPDSPYARQLSGGNLQASLSHDNAYSKHPDVYAAPYLETEKPDWRKRRICCMPSVLFWTLVAMLMLAGVGAIVGGVVAGMKSYPSGSEADTAAQSVFSTTSTIMSNSTNTSISTSTSTSTSISIITSTSTSTNTSTSTSTSTNGITTTIAVSSTTANAVPTPSAVFRSDMWYRFSNSFLGSTMALDVFKNDGLNSRTLSMSSGDNTGQYWQIRAIPPSANPSSSSQSQSRSYWLSSWYLGQSKRLEVADQSSILPYMAPADNTHQGQMWQFTQWKDGTWALSNGANGRSWNMTIYADTYNLYMRVDAEDSAQHWSVESIYEILDSAWET